MNMDDAPKDGTRILIRTWLWGYVDSAGRQLRSKRTQIIECYWKEGKWREWVGGGSNMSTAYIDPIDWAPVPDELKGDIE